MFFGEWKTTVNAPRETVWQFVKDAENIDAWFPRRQSFSRPKYDGGFFLKQIDIQPDVAQGTFTVTNVVPGEEVSESARSRLWSSSSSTPVKDARFG